MEIQRTASFERLADFIRVCNILKSVHQVKSDEDACQKLKLNEPGRSLNIRTFGKMVDINDLEEIITENMESYVNNTKFGELKDACHAYRRVFKTSIRSVHFYSNNVHNFRICSKYRTTTKGFSIELSPSLTLPKTDMEIIKNAITKTANTFIRLTCPNARSIFSIDVK